MIIGEKVMLCGLTRASSDEILEWVNLPELKDLTGTVYPISDYEHERWMETRAISKSDKLFLIKDKETKVNIGIIGLKNIDFINSNAELYISIGKQEFRNEHGAPGGVAGYGTDAVNALVGFCFGILNLHRVYLHVFEENERAIACYKKCGFDIDGRLREHHYRNGSYHAVLIMGILNKPK